MKTIIVQLSNKDVTTKFGQKKVYSIKADDGQWYSCGFKKPTANAGDEVEFQFTSTSYGNQIDMATFVSLRGGLSSGATAVPTPSAPPVVRPAYGNKGVFPIPALDGQRAIVRQNALTNAREMWCHLNTGSKDITEADVMGIIKVARKFEAYACGDLDREAAEESLAEEKVTKKAGKAKPLGIEGIED